MNDGKVNKKRRVKKEDHKKTKKLTFSSKKRRVNPAINELT